MACFLLLLLLECSRLHLLRSPSNLSVSTLVLNFQQHLHFKVQTAVTMPPLHIALAGATGNLGLPIFSAFLSAGHSVTVLSRQTSTSSSKLPTHPNVKVAHVDFSSTASLIPALTSIQVVISCRITSVLGTQTPLIDAAVAAGVTRFIPAEFLMDSKNELAMRLPVCTPRPKRRRTWPPRPETI
jgi:hypothetical protein